MQRLVPFLALGIVLGFSAAAFLVVDPPPAFRHIRHGGIAVNLYNFIDPCVKDMDDKVKNPACQPRRPQHPAKSLKPAPYKMADPFWDRA